MPRRIALVLHGLGVIAIICITGALSAEAPSCATGPPTEALDVPSLIQRKSTFEKINDVTASECPNLAVFFDGTWNELNEMCSWPPTKSCEANIAFLWRLANEGNGEQLSHYEPGVASSSSPNDDGNLGVGTKQHMLNVYKWLSENYQSCGNKIFVFGFSRGTLSARMLQGMIHRVGLAKSGNWSEAAHVQFNSDEHAAAEFKNSNKVWQDVNIEFMGFFDAVLRTLLHPLQHSDIGSFHMTMTSSVKHFAHAIALSEHREIFQSAELYVDATTQSKQVWFAGVHSDVGGGYGMNGIARISAGWMADEAVAAGFMLPSGWRTREDMRVDFMDDIFVEKGLGPTGTVLAGVHIELDLKLATIRNPARCRQNENHPFQNQQILIHQSVSDRMQENAGWKPLPWCCEDILANMTNNFAYTTNEHYTVAKSNYQPSQNPQWIKIHFGWLREVAPHEIFGNPEFYVKVTSWHDDVPLPAQGGIGNYDGCCTVIHEHPASGSGEKYGSYWSGYKAKQNFAGMTVVLPNEHAVANKILIEVHEDDVIFDDYVGRAEVPLDEPSTWEMKTYPMSHGGTIEVKIEPINTDENAEAVLPGSGPAQCRWLDIQTGLSREQLCQPVSIFSGWTHAASATDCAGFIEDITSGA